ncbi:MAG: hypothetical protein K0R60_154, partial [Microbacterium sp.]|nr:hypothetical protein [Microbacterium sp.]
PPAAPGDGGYPAPAYGTQPPYGAQPSYGTQQGYGAAPYTPYPSAPKTNTMAIVSLIASIVGFVFLPFIGSLAGVITGHIALRQLKTSGENGRGMALAGTIVGWVGLALSVIITVIIIISVVYAINSSGSYYDSYSSLS